MTDYKLADYFAVIGLDEELLPYDQSQDTTVEGLQLVVMEESETIPSYVASKEKWIDLDGRKKFYLRLTYGKEKSPITDINFYRIKTQKNRLAIPSQMDITPVQIRQYNDPNPPFKKTKRTNPSNPNEFKTFYYGDFDLGEYLEEENLGKEKAGTVLCMCFSRSKKQLPVQDIEIFVGGASTSETMGFHFNIPKAFKHINYRLGHIVKNRLLAIKQMNVLRKKYQAKVLDRYPLQDRGYYQFDATLSQFCFSSGIKFTTERCTPTFFSFILTDANATRIYATALIFDEVLSPELKHLLKQYHITNIDSIYVQKAICILSHYSFLESFKDVLKQVYRIHLSKNHVPIERFICNFMDEVPVPDKGTIFVEYDLAGTKVPFYRPKDQYQPYASQVEIENLFRALDAESVIQIVLTLMQERKVLLMSQHKSLLTQCCVALTSLLFPFAWCHVLIPILPEHFRDFVEAPVPYLIGIETSLLTEDLEIPDDVSRADLDNGLVSLRDVRPKMPQKAYRTLYQKVFKATEWISRPDPKLHQIDYAFNTVFEDPADEMHVDEVEIRDAFFEFMCSVMQGYQNFLIYPDATNSTFINSRDFFNVDKFRASQDGIKPVTFVYKLTETQIFSDFIDARSFGRTEYDDQICFFDEALKQKRTKKNPTIIKAFEPLKKVKALTPLEDGLTGLLYNYETFPKFDHGNFYPPRPITNYNEEPSQLLKMMLQPDQIRNMNDAEYARYSAEVVYLLWYHILSTNFVYYHQHAKELISFSRQMLSYLVRKIKPMIHTEYIYRKLFEMCGNARLKDEIIDIFKELKRAKIVPDKVTFGTYYHAFQLANSTEKKGEFNKKSYFRAQTGSNGKPPLLIGSNRPSQEEEKQMRRTSQEEEKVGRGSGGTFTQANSQCETTDTQQTRLSQIKLSQILESHIYIEIDQECSNCERALKEEEMISGFSKNVNEYIICCPYPDCKSNFVPRFTVYSEFPQKIYRLNGRDGTSIQLLAPAALHKEFINCVNQKGESILTKEAFLQDHQIIFWNLVLYFKMFKLPIFLLDLDFTEQHIKVQVSWIKKYLPSDKGPASTSQVRSLNKDALRRLAEQSPARKNSIGRAPSTKGDPETGSQISVGEKTEKNSLSNFFMKKLDGSVRSGSGPGSIITSISDIERVEKFMNSSQYAEKNIVKYFGKHIDEFRRDQASYRELILSDIANQQIPAKLTKQALINTAPNHFSKNFQDVKKQTPLSPDLADHIMSSGGPQIPIGTQPTFGLKQRVGPGSNLGQKVTRNSGSNLSSAPSVDGKTGYMQRPPSGAGAQNNQ